MRYNKIFCKNNPDTRKAQSNNTLKDEYCPQECEFPQMKSIVTNSV